MHGWPLRLIFAPSYVILLVTSIYFCTTHRLCGYSLFFSENGLAIFTGMKRLLLNGQYEFLNRECKTPNSNWIGCFIKLQICQVNTLSFYNMFTFTHAYLFEIDLISICLISNSWFERCLWDAENTSTCPYSLTTAAISWGPTKPLHTSCMLHEEQDVWENGKVSVGAIMCHFVAASLDAQKKLLDLFLIHKKKWVEQRLDFDNIIFMLLCIPDSVTEKWNPHYIIFKLFKLFAIIRRKLTNALQTMRMDYDQIKIKTIIYIRRVFIFLMYILSELCWCQLDNGLFSACFLSLKLSVVSF